MVFFHRHFILIFFQVSFLWGCSGIDEIKGVFTSPFWNEYDSSSNLFVDHTSWGYLLNKHVQLKTDGTTVIAYANFTQPDRQVLEKYIQSLASFPIEKLNRKEQYAFWLNLYNALVVRLVLEHYLILSIADIEGDDNFLKRGPFNRQLIIIKGWPLSLSFIRKKILSNLFLDPRFHYGLCDAAVGSPRLQRRPYTGDKVDRMLDEAALEYINHSRTVSVKKGKVLVLSALYEMYPEEFGHTFPEIFQHIRLYAMDHVKNKLSSAVQVTFDFDWSLNDGIKLK